jgi:ABC-type cobalamin transport system permease subunit
MVLNVLLAQQFSINSNTKQLLVVCAVAFCCLFLWQLLVSSSKTIVPFFRKFLLIGFSLLLLCPYMKCANYLADYMVNSFNLNYHLGKMLNEFKGTDWADGLLLATFFFIYFGIVLHLWNVEKKASKPPPKEPIKIDAKIGNTKD